MHHLCCYAGGSPVSGQHVCLLLLCILHVCPSLDCHGTKANRPFDAVIMIDASRLFILLNSSNRSSNHWVTLTFDLAFRSANR